jgi:hypothetical protein
MNRKRLRRGLGQLACALVLVSGTALYGQQTFKTTIYFDYTSYLTSKGPRTNPGGDPSFKNNFFTFRRAYFNYENKISDNLKFRFRYDADNVTAVDASGKKDDKLRPFLKHLFLEYSNLIPDSKIKIGLTETLTFNRAEECWGYRSVAKTLMDGYKDVTGKDVKATSADLGASLTGSLSKYLQYGFMISNGSAYSHPENNKFKKLMFQAQVVPVAGFTVVGYCDYEKQTADAKAVTYKVDAYIQKFQNLSIGAEWFIYKNGLNMTASLERYDMSGYSIFGRYNFVQDKFAGFARYDRYEPNNKTSQDETHLVIAGLDWAPFDKSIKIQPNVNVYSYADPAKKNDVIFNLTFFMSF